MIAFTPFGPGALSKGTLQHALSLREEVEGEVRAEFVDETVLDDFSGEQPDIALARNDADSAEQHLRASPDDGSFGPTWFWPLRLQADSGATPAIHISWDAGLSGSAYTRRIRHGGSNPYWYPPTILTFLS